MSSRPVTVVTGGGRGIGAATVAHLVDLGHDVAIGYLGDATAADAVVTAARAAGAQVVAVRGDVVDADDVDALFEAAANLGPVTGLVNNAGLTAHSGTSPTPPCRCCAAWSRSTSSGRCCAPAGQPR